MTESEGRGCIPGLAVANPADFRKAGGHHPKLSLGYLKGCVPLRGLSPTGLVLTAAFSGVIHLDPDLGLRIFHVPHSGVSFPQRLTYGPFDAFSTIIVGIGDLLAAGIHQVVPLVPELLPTG